MEYLGNYVDSVSNLLVEVQARHYQKWPFLGVATASPELEPIPETYAAEMEALKDWIAIRLDWLDANLPQECTGIPIGIEQENGLTNWVYPNPSTGQFTIQNRVDFLRVYALDGRLVQSHQMQGLSSPVTFTINQKGVFVVVYTSADKIRYQRVVVK